MASKSAARRAWRVARGKIDPRCDYCSEETSEQVHEGHPKRATVDDMIPLSRGGRNAPGNWALACNDCNSRKGDAIIEPGDLPAPQPRHRLTQWEKRQRKHRRAHVERIEEVERLARLARLPFTIYPPIPGVPDEAIR